MEMRNALLGTGFPYREVDYLDQYLAIFRQLAQQSAGIRRPGSAALDLAFTAAGRYDGFWEFRLKPWDIAAGVLLVREAGGIVTDARGEENFLTNGDVVAGNIKIHHALLSAIRPHYPVTSVSY